MKILRLITLLIIAMGSFAFKAQALSFTNYFDGSWGAELSIGQTAATSAESILSGIFVGSNVTINIDFSYGSSAGGGAYADFNTNDFPSPYGTNPGLTYAQVKTDLQNASSANPTNAPLSGVVSNLPASISSTAKFFIPEAEAMALGVPAGQYPSDTHQGYITVGNGSVWDPTESDGITAGQGDLTGVLLHEISHVMGRVDYAFAPANGVDLVLTPLDLSRYTVGGGLNFTNSNAVFSINGGVTALAGYSHTSDTGDWGSLTASNDVNNAFFSYGTVGHWSTVDTEVMQALGWETSTSSAPDGGTTAAMLGSALFGLAALRRKSSQASSLDVGSSRPA